EAPGGADHPAGDLAAIGDQDLREQHFTTKGTKESRRSQRRPNTHRVLCESFVSFVVSVFPFFCRHIRKMPKRVGSIGALSAAEIDSPKTRRVSAGSMMPSSQSRALA